MYKNSFNALPESIQSLIRHGISLVRPRKVVLFGSRARGDHRPNSDFDIAFSNLGKPEMWTRFKAGAEEEPFTLYNTDLVIFEEMNSAYQANITSEGKTLYDAN